MTHSARASLLGGCSCSRWRMAQPADAQETRAAEIAAEQARKAAEVEAVRAGGGRTMGDATEERVPDRARRGSIRTSPASTAAAASRSAPATGSSPATARTGTSRGSTRSRTTRSSSSTRIRGATRAAASICTARWAGGMRRRSRYYGLGMATSPSDEANFGLEQTYIGGDVQIGPATSPSFGLGMTYDDYTMEQGPERRRRSKRSSRRRPRRASATARTTCAPSLSGGIDWRPSPGYARRGGLYQVTYHNYIDLDETYSFDRVDGEIVQHVPILRETWVISLHGLVQTTLDDEDVVPYFLMPSLGSGSTLRAYPSGRYRDRHSLLLSGRVALDPEPPGARHGDLLRHGQGREPLGRPEPERPEEQRRYRRALPRPALDAAAHRAGARA